MGEKYQYKKIMSPEGTLIWPHLNTPDDKFVKPDGVYHCKLAVEKGDDLDAYVAQLEAERDRFIAANPKGYKGATLKSFGKKIADLYDDEFDDEGEETGRVIFKYKLKPFFGKDNEYTQEPKLYDPRGVKYSPYPNVGNDTVAKIHGEMFPYYMESNKETGVSLRCQNVQVLELVEYSGGEENPFGDESGGDTFGEDGGDDPDF
jgi:hypothetical protein